MLIVGVNNRSISEGNVSLFKKISSLVAVGVLLVAFMVPVAQAQETNGSGLQISPTRTEIDGQAGDVKTFKISLKNVTQGAVFAKAYLNDFESDGVTGTPKIVTDTSKRTPYTIANMLSGLQDVSLKPGESKSIELTVTVPDNVNPGAYFGAVRYAAVPEAQAGNDQSQQVALTASVAHLVFINIPGDVTEQIELQKLDISKDDKTSGIFFSTPNKAKLTVKNLGNGFSRPFGNVVIQNSSGKEVFSYDVNATEPKGIVLPNSTRVFDNKIEKISRPGKYKAVASVAYGNGGEIVNYETSFWYLPVWFLAVAAGVLILLIGGGFFGYKKFVSKAGK